VKQLSIPGTRRFQPNHYRLRGDEFIRQQMRAHRQAIKEKTMEIHEQMARLQTEYAQRQDLDAKLDAQMAQLHAQRQENAKASIRIEGAMMALRELAAANQIPLEPAKPEEPKDAA
jgi:hypothetical protein